MTKIAHLTPGVALLALGLTFGPAALAAPPGPMPFGAYDPEGYFTSDSDLTIEHVFMPWEDVNLASLVEADRYAMERKRALLITIEPWTWTRDERNTKEFLLNGIKAGYYDANMRAICGVVGELSSPVSIRWGHEMEVTDGQFIWSNWAPEDYISSFRRMIEICRDEAPRANIVWSPLGESNASDYYPGDEYVDLIGLSVFGYENWEKEVLGAPRDYASLLTERYNEVKAFNKPVFVAEAGSTGSADYVALWDRQQREARPDLPLLTGSVYFNQREVYPWPNDFPLPDWRIEHRVLP